MKVIKKPRTVFFDVDDTLVLYDRPKDTQIDIQCYEDILKVTPHKTHIRYLRQSKQRGFYVVVWTHQGHEWAEAVIRALKLEPYVDLIMDKPAEFFDDSDIDKQFKRIWEEDKD